MLQYFTKFRFSLKSLAGDTTLNETIAYSLVTLKNNNISSFLSGTSASFPRSAI